MLRIDDMPQQVADDIQGFALIYLRKCDIIDSLKIGDLMKTIAVIKEGVFVMYVE